MSRKQPSPNAEQRFEIRNSSPLCVPHTQMLVSGISCNSIKQATDHTESEVTLHCFTEPAKLQALLLRLRPSSKVKSNLRRQGAWRDVMCATEGGKEIVESVVIRKVDGG